VIALPMASLGAGAAPRLQTRTQIADPAQSPWPQFQGSADHGGVSPFDEPAPGLKEAWRFDLPEGEEELSGPVIAGGLVLSAAQTAVYAVEPDTGELRWKVPREQGPSAVPAVAEVRGTRVLLVPEGASAKEARLVAYSMEDREQLWEVPLSDRAGRAVAVHGDLAFVGDVSGNLYAVRVSVEAVEDAEDLVEWRFRPGGGVEGILDAPVAIGGGRVFAVVRNGTTGQVEVVAFDERTGRREWTFTPPTLPSVGSPVTVGRDGVYFGLGDQYVYGVDAASGMERWATRVRSPFFPVVAPALTPGGALLAAPTLPGLESGLYRIDAETGERSSPWRQGGDTGVWDFDFDASNLASSPVVVGGHVYMGLGDGRLVAIDLATGKLVWSADTGEGGLGPIAAADGMLVVTRGGDDGGLVAFRHDPDGALVSVDSPTRLDPGESLLNYAVAFAAVAGAYSVLWLAARLVRARRGGDTDPEAGNRARDVPGESPP
jgi:outer membrane protein assembly factor BamB